MFVALSLPPGPYNLGLGMSKSICFRIGLLSVALWGWQFETKKKFYG